MFTLNFNGKLVAAENPLVMGIINVTDDSFYEESRHRDVDAVLQQAEKMIHEGADILDVGGQSTRPGSTQKSVSEELKNVIPAISAIHQQFPDQIISVDTFYARVAEEAVQAGASMINDISAGTMDEQMIETVASLKVPYVLMHMQGKPGTMQNNPVYENLTREILDFFIQQISRLEKAGISDIIIDPGFGFGKTISHNFEILKNLSVFSITGRPVMIGVSRKSTIYKTLGVSAKEALNGTTVLHTIGLMNGASVLRVHDVKEAKEAVTLCSHVKK